MELHFYSICILHTFTICPVFYEGSTPRMNENVNVVMHAFVSATIYVYCNRFNVKLLLYWAKT